MPLIPATSFGSCARSFRRRFNANALNTANGTSDVDARAIFQGGDVVGAQVVSLKSRETKATKPLASADIRNYQLTVTCTQADKFYGSQASTGAGLEARQGIRANRSPGPPGSWLQSDERSEIRRRHTPSHQQKRFLPAAQIRHPAQGKASQECAVARTYVMSGRQRERQSMMQPLSGLKEWADANPG